MSIRKPWNMPALVAALALLLPAFAWATYPAEVARTGQTACYDASGAVVACAGTGQDGDLLAGAPWPDPRFSSNGDGTVTDSLTGLVWAQNANLPNGSKTWQEALEYVADMNAGIHPNLGYTDWRLPNVHELESLLNAQLHNPALPQGHPFTNVHTNYLSSTSVASDTSNAWIVYMSSEYYVSYYNKTNNGYVWPVREGQCGALGNSVICLPKTGQTSCFNSSGTSVTCTGTGQDGELQKGVAWPSSRFVDNGDGTVTDSLTGLEWTKDANLPSGAKTWQEALNYVKTFTAGGHGDWRLPNERELRSLADYSKYSPALPQDHPFTNVESVPYWSSTSYAGSTGSARFVDMYDGNVFNTGKTYSYYVWLVRAGEVGNPLISTTTTTAVATTSVSITTTVSTTTTPVISSTSTTAGGDETTTTVARAFPAEVARTGQTACYDASGAVVACAGTGQDGDLLAGAPWPDPRFSSNGDGTVTDSLTGLVWAQNANLPNGTLTWTEAFDYVKGMNAGTNPNFGYTDWHLPNVNEFESLINDQFYNPALPQGHPFTNVQSYYWSSTSGAITGDSVWLFFMDNGRLGSYGKANSRYYIWPVRAEQCGALGNSVICLPKTGQTSCYSTGGRYIDCSGTGQDGDIQAGVAWPSPRFVDNGETVTDSLTGLEWTKDANLAGATMTWQNALNYVKTLTTGGHSDWRLPSEWELRSLVDYSKYSPALPQGHPFTNVQFDIYFYWSSTSYANYTNCAKSVWMGNGNIGYEGKSSSLHVWPVRAGQVGNPLISTTTTTAVATTSVSITTTVLTTTTPVISSITTTSVAPATTTTITRAFPAEVARTGQTTCYDASGSEIACAGTGQDGDVLAGAPWPDPRFSNNGDGTVTDSLTGLVWSQNANVPNGSKTWQAALEYVAGMNAGTNPNLGYTDWRLPNVNELESLLNAQLNNPALPQGHPFTNVMESPYWSSTSYADTTSYAWAVSMYSGYVFSYGKTNNGYVWPVRAGQCGPLSTSIICLPKTGQTGCFNSSGASVTCSGTGQDGDIQAGVAWPSPRFVDNSDGTVTDSLTGLEWAKNANIAGDGKTWQGALDYVKTLTTGSHGDWRLPNERELRSLADYSKYSPALPQDHPFTNVESVPYWSSTSYAGSTGSAWFVEMYDGNVFSDGKTDYVYVWPVRAGEVGNPLISTTTTTAVATTSVSITTTVVTTTTPVISSTTTTSVQPITSTSMVPASTTTTAPVDTDGDGIPDSIDNCPNTYNPQQLDADHDGIGDVCDTTPGCGGCGGAACEQYDDTDSDGIPDVIDNCPNTYNPNQLDADHDGIGDCCDPSPGCGGCGGVVCEAACTHP